MQFVRRAPYEIKETTLKNFLGLTFSTLIGNQLVTGYFLLGALYFAINWPYRIIYYMTRAITSAEV